VIQRGGHHSADHRGRDVLSLQAGVLDQCQQPDRIFIRGALRVGADTPTAAPTRRIVDGEDDIGVAGIDDEQHGFVPDPAGRLRARAEPHQAGRGRGRPVADDRPETGSQFCGLWSAQR
jgi:hypothetical protein